MLDNIFLKREKKAVHPWRGLLICFILFMGVIYLHLNPEILNGFFLEEELTHLAEEKDRDLQANSLWKKRKGELEARKRELKELEFDIENQKSKIKTKIRYLEEMREQLTSLLKKGIAVNEERVKKLVGFYSSMQPQHAARIISNIDEDLAVAILGQMRRAQAAEIMNQLEPQKVQKLSEKFMKR